MHPGDLKGARRWLRAPDIGPARRHRAVERGADFRQQGVTADASNPRVGGAERPLDHAAEDGSQVRGHRHTEVIALAGSTPATALVQVSIGPDHGARLAPGL
jgi:hypothetical protein